MDGCRVAGWERLEAGHEDDNVRDGGGVFEREDAVCFVDLLWVD